MKTVKYLLAALLLLVLCGCHETAQVRYLGVLQSSDKSTGLIVYLDEDYQEIGQQSCLNPLTFYKDEKSLYISADGSSYQGYALNGPQTTGSLRNITGELLVHNSNGSYYALQDNRLVFHDGQQVSDMGQEVFSLSYADEDYLYLVGYDNHLRVYDRKQARKIADSIIFDLPVGFGRIEGQTCLATDRGIAPLKDGQMDLTLLYPVSFTSVSNIIDDHIFGYEGEELAVYTVRFDGLQMRLELEKDEIYYREVDLDELFRSYQNEGWKLVYFQGLGV